MAEEVKAAVAESEGKNFIDAFIEEDIAEGGRFQGQQVHTRFPPEPNGYLHIGHCKALTIDFGTAEPFGGLCNLRMDDTNPTKEDVEFVDAIKEDIHWLGFDWGDRFFYGSDYFEEDYRQAVGLIKKGLAYVCDLTPEQVNDAHRYGVTGWSAKQMDNYLEKATRNTQDYMIRVRTSTTDKAARKWLDKTTEKLHFVLPADKPLKKQADRDELAQKRIGADTAWKIMSAALLRKEPWGCAVDEATAQKVLDEMRDYYENRFLDWAKEGDAYGMERLKRDVESVLGEAVEVIDDKHGAVFADNLY